MNNPIKKSKYPTLEKMERKVNIWGTPLIFVAKLIVPTTRKITPIKNSKKAL